MGWTYQHKDSTVSVKDFFSTEFNWESGGTKVKVLDCAVVWLRTAYLAVERIHEDKRIVFGMVCLLDYRPNAVYHNFGYKDMDEGVQPYYYDCPKRILNLLTDTDNENALEWRKACLDNLNKKKSKPKLKTGHWIWLESPVTFTSGDELQAFYIADAKRRDFRKHEQGYSSYKLSKRILDRGFQVLTLDEVKAKVLEKCKQ